MKKLVFVLSLSFIVGYIACADDLSLDEILKLDYAKNEQDIKELVLSAEIDVLKKLIEEKRLLFLKHIRNESSVDDYLTTAAKDYVSCVNTSVHVLRSNADNKEAKSLLDDEGVFYLGAGSIILFNRKFISSLDRCKKVGLLDGIKFLNFMKDASNALFNEEMLYNDENLVKWSLAPSIFEKLSKFFEDESLYKDIVLYERLFIMYFLKIRIKIQEYDNNGVSNIQTILNEYTSGIRKLEIANADAGTDTAADANKDNNKDIDKKDHKAIQTDSTQQKKDKDDIDKIVKEAKRTFQIRQDKAFYISEPHVYENGDLYEYRERFRRSYAEYQTEKQRLRNDKRNRKIIQMPKKVIIDANNYISNFNKLKLKYSIYNNQEIDSYIIREQNLNIYKTAKWVADNFK